MLTRGVHEVQKKPTSKKRGLCEFCDEVVTPFNAMHRHFKEDMGFKFRCDFPDPKGWVNEKKPLIKKNTSLSAKNSHTCVFVRGKQQILYLKKCSL